MCLLFKIDLENNYGRLKFGQTTWLISSDQSISFQIESYKQTLNFTYKYEALPLDYLIINDQNVGGKECETKQSEWLNCFESDNLLSIQKCQNSIKYNFSYGFKEADSYIGCQQKSSIIAQSFQKNFNIIC
jgi:hypothetical protein